MRRKFRRALVGLLDRYVGREIIGQAECPMMLRWSLWLPGPKGEPWLKFLIHYFPAEVSDRDPHDHPRSFVTFVLRGGYRDESWDEPGFEARQSSPDHIPTFDKLRKTERVRAGAVRYRPAKYMHIVETDEVGCWTFVVMGPLQREWGFRRLDSGKWWPVKKYLDRFGGVARCDAPAAENTPIFPLPEMDPELKEGLDEFKATERQRRFHSAPPPELR